jgi:hypothetical protein
MSKRLKPRNRARNVATFAVEVNRDNDPNCEFNIVVMELLDFAPPRNYGLVLIWPEGKEQVEGCYETKLQAIVTAYGVITRTLRENDCTGDKS